MNSKPPFLQSGGRVSIGFAVMVASVAIFDVSCSDGNSTGTRNGQQSTGGSFGGESVQGAAGRSDPGPSNQAGGGELGSDTQPVSGRAGATGEDGASAQAVLACSRYMQAICERRSECGLSSADCTKAGAECPDAVFAPGSTREPSSTMDCAVEMRQRDCMDVYRNVEPQCAAAGTRKAGESCIAGVQCESRACSGSGSSCGVCLERVGENEDCTSASKVACDAGLTCSPSSHLCVPLAQKSFSLVVSTELGVGKLCNARNLCGTGTYCKLDTTGNGICTARLPEGADCTSSTMCLEGTYCFQEGSACRKVPAAQNKCGNDVETGNAVWCTDDCYCDQVDYACKPFPQPGEPCVATLLSGGANVCGPKEYCDGSSEPPVCTTLAAGGEGCASELDCRPGLRCLCSDASCTEKLCGVYHDVNESCANPGERCSIVSSCVDGLCRANASPDLFAKLCGG